MTIRYWDRRTLYIFFSFLAMFLVAASRSKYVGGDLMMHYIPKFYYYGRESLDSILGARTKYGFFFLLLCKLSYCISPNYQSFLAVTSAISLIPVALFIKRYSPKPWLSVYLYVTFALYTNTFNSVRSSIAVGIGLIMIKYILNREFLKFLFFYIIAMEIHQTFCLFILLYPLFLKKMTLKYILATLGISFIAAQTPRVFSMATSLVNGYDAVYERVNLSNSGGYSMMVFLSLITILAFCLNKKNMTPSTHLFVHCMLIASCVQCFANINTLVVRISLFFYIVSIALIPITIENVKKMGRMVYRISLIVTLIFFFGYFCVFVMTPKSNFGNSNYQKTIPYETSF